MIYFVLLAIIITVSVGRSPMKCLDRIEIRLPALFIGSLLSQVILFVLFRLNPITYSYLFELTLIVLIIGLWLNRRIYGFKWILVGTILNLLAVIVHNGRMPVMEEALEIARISYTPDDARHQLLIDSTFWWLGDWIPLYKKVISLGDVCIGLGVIVFLLYNSPSRRANETS